MIKFSNEELRWLHVKELNLSMHNPTYIQLLFGEEQFKQVKVGELWQIYWLNIAKMKDEYGNSIPCDFDMSPEYVYMNSKK